MTVVFVFKNGYELKVKCENFTLTVHSLTGQITGYEMNGIEGNKLLYVDLNEILCIYRVSPDEKGGAE